MSRVAASEDLGILASLAHDASFVRRCREYGVTIREAVRGWREAGSGCAICGKEADPRALVFDHNHRSGQFRGLLCQRCNTGIGLLGDSAKTLGSASEYLRENGTYSTEFVIPGFDEARAYAWLHEMRFWSDLTHHVPTHGVFTRHGYEGEKPTAIKASEHKHFHRLSRHLGLVGMDRLEVGAGHRVDGCYLCEADARDNTCHADCLNLQLIEKGE